VDHYTTSFVKKATGFSLSFVQYSVEKNEYIQLIKFAKIQTPPIKKAPLRGLL